MKALIVEDIPESQQLLCEVARAAWPGITCQAVAEVGQALNRLAEGWSVALVDLSLPDGSGVDVVARLSRVEPTCTIVVATIHDDDDHLFAALRAGAQGYLLKDEETGQLIERLQGIRQGQLPLSPSIARRILRFFQNTPPPQRATEALTPRECEVLGLLARGVSIAGIARQLGISHHTVGDHVKAIYRKLEISSRAEAALHARDLGLL